jgi:hypothetical protein
MNEGLKKALGPLAPLVHVLPNPAPGFRIGVFYNEEQDQLEFWYLKCKSLIVVFEITCAKDPIYIFEFWLRNCLQKFADDAMTSNYVYRIGLLKRCANERRLS